MKKIISILLLGLLVCGCNDNKTKMTDDETSARDSEKANSDPLFRLDQDSVKSAYGPRFDELRTIINKHDPIGLLSLGAPEDEYEPEVKTIIVQLDTNKTSELQIHDLIYREFLRWFDDESTAGPKDAYKDLAKDIFIWTQTQRPANSG